MFNGVCIDDWILEKSANINTELEKEIV